VRVRAHARTRVTAVVTIRAEDGLTPQKLRVCLYEYTIKLSKYIKYPSPKMNIRNKSWLLPSGFPFRVSLPVAKFGPNYFNCIHVDLDLRVTEEFCHKITSIAENPQIACYLRDVTSFSLVGTYQRYLHLILP
jgi:hypothetical protein